MGDSRRGRSQTHPTDCEQPDRACRKAGAGWESRTGAGGKPPSDGGQPELHPPEKSAPDRYPNRRPNSLQSAVNRSRARAEKSVPDGNRNRVPEANPPRPAGSNNARSRRKSVPPGQTGDRRSSPPSGCGQPSPLAPEMSVPHGKLVTGGRRPDSPNAKQPASDGRNAHTKIAPGDRDPLWHPRPPMCGGQTTHPSQDQLAVDNRTHVRRKSRWWVGDLNRGPEASAIITSTATG